jgi:tRNA A-37 threonylcarbamoyl transferase component Bud32/tetratricopeptide (TPR) repeat protein
MTPEQWETLQDLFHEIVQEPLEERPGALSRLESQIQDPAIRMELRRLVEHAEVGAEFLRPVAGLARFADTPVLQPGDVIADRFEIVKSIGKGGMAEVFEAFDRKLGERVAIKIIASEFARDASLLERFHQEVQIARRITHANICRIHDLGEHRGLPYLSMEFLEGETLSKVLERGPLPLDTWNDLAEQLLRGLQAAHAAGIAHRDLKPSNLMLTGSRLVILDFGLACPVLTTEDDGLTRPGTIVGTLDWMAPEQLMQKYDQRTDLYSAALILMRALKQGSDNAASGGLAGAMRRALTDTEIHAQMPESLPASWRFALLKCLERDPEQRPRDVEEVRKLVHSNRVVPIKLRHFAGSRRRLIVVAAAVIVLAVLALFAMNPRSLWYPREKRPEGLKPGSVIMIAFADNTTLDSRFDGMTSVLREDFAQSARFNVWNQQRFTQVAQAMRRDPNVVPDAKQWREIAAREGVPLLVFSSLAKVSDGYVFTVRCEQIGASPDTAFQAWQDTESASGPQGVFDAIHKATMRVRELAGENAEEISVHNRMPQDITSSSWRAIGFYSDAQKYNAQGKVEDAISGLRQAIAEDPQFAMGFMRLGDILNSQDHLEEGFSDWRRAIELAGAQHLSQHESWNIQARYALEVKDFAKAEPLLRNWAIEFPNDPLPAQLLAFCLLQRGNYIESVRIGLENQKRFPPTGFATAALIRALASQNDFSGIDKQLDLMEKLDGKNVALGFRGMVAAVRGDYEAARQFIQQAAQSDDVKESSRATAQLAYLEADQGHIEVARQLLAEGIKKDRMSGQDGFAAQKTAALAFLDGFSGNGPLAIAHANEAVSIQRSPMVIVQAVSILARYGSVRDAEKHMKAFPKGEGPKYEADLDGMRGEILLAKGAVQQALKFLRDEAQRYQPQQPKEYLARALDIEGDHKGAMLIYQEIADASFLTWVNEDQFPATRYIARQHLKN